MKALFRQICFTFFVLCSSSVFAAISPYLQVPTESSIWVSWKTESGNESFVRYGISKTQLNRTASGSTQNLGSRYKYHMVNITGLQPDTLYYYQVKTRQEESTVHTFKTAPAPGQSDGVIRFVISGDHQIRGETRYLEMLQKARTKVEQLYGSDVSQHIHMMLNDGDQVDVGTLDHYENLHFAQSVPFATDVPILTAIGNHEYFRDSDLSNYRAHFAYDGLSYRGNSAASDETYYALQYGRVLVIVLNSMEDNTTQENWLSQVLTAADADNSVDWVVSVVHHPYRAENYVSDVRSQWMERLSVSNKHVLNIAGHHHLYARGQKNDASAYHMISGGTAWDQYWGSGGTERDNKEVQKTIANWSWQLVEFDIANREMRVKAYAEAHPILYKEQGMHYNSREIDSFSIKLDNTAPARPTIVGDFTEAQTLPLTLRSSDYRSNGTEQLNTTHFQIATDNSFSNIAVDSLRDYENIYGSSGAPLYEPVDLNANIDILEYTIAPNGIPNGTYHMRVRHRDRNLTWSEWSISQSFTINGSVGGSSEISIASQHLDVNTNFSVTYAYGPGNARDWVGIYKAGDRPRSERSVSYQYTTGSGGTLQFDGLDEGEYFIGFFENNGYTELASRIEFYVGPKAQLATSKSEYAEGADVTINWSNSSTGAQDFIAVYLIGQEPGSSTAAEWVYTPTANGTTTFSALPKGYYYATYIVNDGTTETAERVSFSVGEQIAQIRIPQTQYALNEDIAITFSGGPGIEKDYMGVFAKDAVAVGSTGNELFNYTYFNGEPSGQVTLSYGGQQPLPRGQYFVAMYTNDSYTQVSNRVCFAVDMSYDGNCPALDSGPPTPIEPTISTQVNGSDVTVIWENTSGDSVDRIGIFQQGQQPNDDTLVQQTYISGASGSYTFSGLADDEYYAVILLNDVFQEAGDRSTFTINKETGGSDSDPLLSIESQSGSSITLGWSNTPGNNRGWIGIYKAGDTPGNQRATEWSYIRNQSSGTLVFDGLSTGNYYAVVFLNNGYEEVTSRVNLTVN